MSHGAYSVAMRSYAGLNSFNLKSIQCHAHGLCGHPVHMLRVLKDVTLAAEGLRTLLYVKKITDNNAMAGPHSHWE